MAEGGVRRVQEPQAFHHPSDPKSSQLHPGLVFSPIQYSESDKQRFRDGSPGQRSRIASDHLQKDRQPINDAVTSAVGKDAANALPPDVLDQITSQITASVLQRLSMANNSDGPNPMPSLNSPTVPPVNDIPAPSVQSDNSPPSSHRNVYTPPSPHRPSDEFPLVAPGSPAASAHSTQGRFSPQNNRRPLSATGHQSQSEESHSEKEKEKMIRPKPLVRQSTDITTLEKIWGPLFEGNIATPRLGQLLRGVAQYLVEDFEPKHSLVVTPSKMQKYYEVTKITSELYPWQMVFDDRTSSISRVYREIEAQHHLVQEELHSRPDIPGLTPHGFEKWSTLMILAHPEEEFERLAKAMMDMPICNFDDRSERFPKEISRRLFPKIPDLSVRERLERSLVTYCKVPPLPRSPGIDDQTRQRYQARVESVGSESQPQSSTAPVPSTAAPPTQPIIGYSLSETTSAGSQAGTATERNRSAHSSIVSDVAVEDEEKAAPKPIERERKPYSAQPGGGRNYEDINRPTTPPDSRSTTQSTTTTAPTSSSKVSRSFSTTANSRPMDPSRSQTIPVNYNPSQHPRKAPLQPGMEGISIPSDPSITRHRTNSVLTPHQYTRSTRHRSPSANAQQNADFTRPEADVPPTGPVYQPAGGYGSSYGTSPAADVVDVNRHWGRERERDRDRDRDHRRGERDYLPTGERDRRDSMRNSMYEMSNSTGGLNPADRGVGGSSSAGIGIPIREPRPRYQNNTGGYSVSDVGRGGHYSSDEDYYRSAGTRTSKERHGSNGATGYEGGTRYYN